jgi:hypothetical protein
MKLTLHTLDDMDEAFLELRRALEKGSVEVELTELHGNRTNLQNKSFHLWLSMMAKKMTEHNITNRGLWENMKVSFDIPISQNSLKEIAQKVSEDQFGEKHTSRLDTKQISELYEKLNKAFGLSVGVSMPWPDRFNQEFRGKNER